MLIDSKHIDDLRVNFIAHFNTTNTTVTSSNEILDLIDNYPKQMTSEIRQWLTEQQTNRITAPLATVDVSKSIDDFDDYIKELEENICSYEQNQMNNKKLQVLIGFSFMYRLYVCYYQ